MKNKPLYEPKELLPHFNEILRVLLQGSANVNHIFRHIKQTGLSGARYKRKILDAINYLEKADFIIDTSGYKHYEPGKKETKRLTILGKELAELIDSIDRYYTSYSELSKVIRRDINSPRIKLVEEHKKYNENTELLRLFSPVSIFNIVILRCVSIMLYAENNGKNTDLKKDILNGIIMRSISQHLSFLINDFEDLFKINKGLTRKIITNGIIRERIEQAFVDIIKEALARDLLNRIVVEKEETIHVLLSILLISKPSSTFIDTNIDEVKKLLNPQKKILISDAEVERNKKLLALFEEYNKMRIRE